MSVEGRPQGAGRSIAIVASRFNDVVTERLVDGARAALLEHGVADDDVTVYRVPGAWELPLAVSKVAATGRY
ncbi:MAG: 6,7-dimethyl-8-ribityllumazine synthase, partial [Gammaproteobacteria bacterium]|nr:6,7-dimethyl-8-ribityllumazine synthase [Gemmatimonadota bacterium]NIU73328.1 6,7-dimethyl-8-ribityllumazine synthase [Gammaproteobacteria bacterium]